MNETSNRVDVMVSVNSGPEVSGTLTIEQQMVDVTMSCKVVPDMDWTHVDAAGHWHAYDRAGKLPTINVRTEHVACTGGCGSDGCEGYEVTVHRCRACGQEVEPVTVTTYPTGREYTPGRESWEVEVEQQMADGSVSVRMTAAGGGVFFGVAQVGQSRTYPGSYGSPAMRTVTTLRAAGPLGRRPAVREVARG